MTKNDKNVAKDMLEVVSRIYCFVNNHKDKTNIVMCDDIEVKNNIVHLECHYEYIEKALIDEEIRSLAPSIKRYKIRQILEGIMDLHENRCGPLPYRAMLRYLDENFSTINSWVGHVLTVKDC